MCLAVRRGAHPSCSRRDAEGAEGAEKVTGFARGDSREDAKKLCALQAFSVIRMKRQQTKAAFRRTHDILASLREILFSSSRETLSCAPAKAGASDGLL